MTLSRTTQIHLHEILVEALKPFDVPVANIRNRDPAPIVDWEQFIAYLKVESDTRHPWWEAWYTDVLGVRNMINDRDHFRTAGGDFHIVEDAEVKGWYADYGVGMEPQWEKSYRNILQRCMAVGLTIAANREFHEDSSKDIARWSFEIAPARIGDFFLFEATISVATLQIAPTLQSPLSPSA